MSPSKGGRRIMVAVDAIGVSLLPVSLHWLFPLEVLPSNFRAPVYTESPFFCCFACPRLDLALECKHRKRRKPMLAHVIGSDMREACR